MNSRICQICDIRYPILLGPMLHISKAPLVAAFSEAGGLGCLASSGMTEEEFRGQITLVRKTTDFDDMDLIEINEAFAAMPLVSTKILAKDDEKKWGELKEKTNVNGGAIAIGHPVGASAGTITMTLAYELRRRGGGYGVAAICGGLA